MNLQELCDFCRSLIGTTESIKWENHLVFSVAEKIYIICSLDEDKPTSISIKASPADFDQLTHIAGILPAPYLARNKWIKLERLDVLPREEIEALVRASRALVVAKLPKKTREALAG